MLLLQRENTESPAAGTGLAILYESKSPPSRKGSWGGARNSASRKSETITLAAALALVGAVREAAESGVPMNRHMTAHWARGGITDSQAAWATGRLIKLIADWVGKRGGSIAYVWTRENGDGKGSHVHILLHLPRGLLLGSMTRRWYRQITGRRDVRRGIKTRIIAGNTKASFANSDWYQDNLACAVGYLLKGVGEATAQALALGCWNDGGHITGKRLSISQNLRRAVKARRD